MAIGVTRAKPASIMLSPCIGRSGVMGDVGARISRLLIPPRRRRRRRNKKTRTRIRIKPITPAITPPMMGVLELDFEFEDDGLYKQGHQTHSSMQKVNLYLGVDFPDVVLPAGLPEGVGLEEVGLDGLLLTGVSAENTVIASRSMNGPVPC